MRVYARANMFVRKREKESEREREKEREKEKTVKDMLLLTNVILTFRNATIDSISVGRNRERASIFHYKNAAVVVGRRRGCFVATISFPGKISVRKSNVRILRQRRIGSARREPPTYE